MALVENVQVPAEAVAHGDSDVNASIPNTIAKFGTGSSALSEAVADSVSTGAPVAVIGDNALATTVNIPAGVSVQGPGKIISSSSTAGLTLDSNTRVSGLSVVNLAVARALLSNQNTSNIALSDITALGAVTSAGAPGYAVSLFRNTDSSIHGLRASTYTGGVELTATSRVSLSNLYLSDMKYHAALVAGGYGVLLQGAKGTTIRDMYFRSGNELSADGYTGRHGLYVSVFGTTQCEDTLVSDCVFDYSAKTTQPAGAINIRANNRAVYSNLSIVGTGITGNTADGNITGQLLRDSTVFQRKYANGGNIYAVSWGATQGANVASNCSIEGCNITCAPLNGTIESTGCIGIETTGNRHRVVDTFIDVPEASTPVIVRPNSFNLVYSGLTDPKTAGTAPFFLFEGPVSNVTVSGIKTARPLFSGLSGVTDLTVDFPRMCTAGSAGSILDVHSLISSVSFSGVHLQIQFLGHVTQAAIDSAVATLYFDGTNRPHVPVIVQRTGKAILVRFYDTVTGTVVNASTTTCSCVITLNS